MLNLLNAAMEALLLPLSLKKGGVSHWTVTWRIPYILVCMFCGMNPMSPDEQEMEKLLAS